MATGEIWLIREVKRLCTAYELIKEEIPSQMPLFAACDDVGIPT